MEPLVRSVVPSLALLLAACGGGERAPLAVTVAGQAAPFAPAYLSSPDVASRAAAVVSSAAEVWNAPPGALDGHLLVLEQAPFDCGRDGIEAEHIVGCTWKSTHVIQVLALGAACPEATVIAHEVGHAVLADEHHRDRRWRDGIFWQRMLGAMERTAPPDCSLKRFVEFNEVHGDDDDDRDDD